MDTMVPLGNLQDADNAGRSERRDAAANRALILQTAQTLFDEQGVAAVNMADIAAAANVGKGTLYRRFPNKAELCLALLDAQMTEFQNRSLARMRQLTAANVGKLEQLGDFLDALIQFTDTHMPLLCEVQQLGLLGGSVDQQRPHYWMHMTISGLLQSAIARQEAAADLDVPYISDAILATLRADVFRFQREGRGFSLERIGAGLRSLLMGLEL